MHTVTISSNYQVAIPRAIRDQFGLKPGQKLSIIPYRNTLRVVIVSPIAEAEGMFEGIEGVRYIEKTE
jgi:AbrB family looped-hinge helix DNA binding protein